MPRTRDDIERFLQAYGRGFTVLDEATFLVTLAPRQSPAVIRVQPPVVLVQLDVGQVQFDTVERKCAFYQKLLELNTTDLLHASYGLDAEHVVLSAALELDHLDDNELEAALADVALALGNHIPLLRQMVPAKA
jgi:hypothetical protein